MTQQFKVHLAAFIKVSLAAFGAGWTTVFTNNLALCLRDLKSSVFAI